MEIAQQPGGGSIQHGAERLTPQLGHDHVEVRDVVPVEHDTLQVALRVANPQGVPEDAPGDG